MTHHAIARRVSDAYRTADELDISPQLKRIRAIMALLRVQEKAEEEKANERMPRM